jgi:hypothetical protein
VRPLYKSLCSSTIYFRNIHGGYVKTKKNLLWFPFQFLGNVMDLKCNPISLGLHFIVFECCIDDDIWTLNCIANFFLWMIKIPSNIFYIGIFKEHNYQEMHVVQPLELKILDLFLGLFKWHKECSIYAQCTHLDLILKFWDSLGRTQNVGYL